jgi:hypothetical protein
LTRAIQTADDPTGEGKAVEANGTSSNQLDGTHRVRVVTEAKPPPASRV